MSYPTDAELFGEDIVIPGTSTPAHDSVRDAYPPTPVRTRSARDLQRNPPPPVESVLSLSPTGANGFLDRGCLTMLFGEPKAGKSWAALEIARRVATGTPFLGITPTTPGPVLYLDFEMSHTVWHDRLARLEAADPTSTTGWPEDLHIACRIDDPTIDFYSRDSIEATVAALRPVLVVVDTFRGASNEDENTTAAGKFLRENIRETLVATMSAPPAVLFLHHAVKSRAAEGMARASGTGDLYAGADTGAELQVKDGTIRLVVHGGRFEVPPPVTYRLDSFEGGGRRFVRTAADIDIPETRRDDQRVWEILGELQDAGIPTTRTEVAAAWSDGEKPTATVTKRVERALDRLGKANRVREEQATVADARGRNVPRLLYHPLGRGVRTTGAWPVQDRS